MPILLIVVAALVIGNQFRLEHIIRKNGETLNDVSGIVAALAVADSRELDLLYKEMEAGIRARLDGSVVPIRQAN